jgi:hypothetical protein
MSLLWKLNRLERMGPREIAYRCAQFARARLEAVGFGLAKVPQIQGVPGKAWLDELPSSIDPLVIRQAAEKILSGNFDVFALKSATLGFPPPWNRDPRTGRVAPLTFGKTLDYRDERIVGDIKYLWEPSRHLELVTLAQAWRLTREERFLAGCRSLLDSWMAQCPYPLGVHWTSSLEHGVRLVNWVFAWHLLGGEQSELFRDADGRAFRLRWLQCVYRHCHFIASHFSRFSSANNHLLGEYMGLLVANLTWPYWPEHTRWLSIAHRGFEREALLQNGRDGVNREQALWYHHEVADMMLLCGLLARANGKDFSAAYWQRLEAMLDFIASVMDAGGNVPAIGDSDDAVMVRLDPSRQFDPYRSLLATGAVLFDRGDFKAKVRTFDAKSRWLLGERGAERFAALAATPRPPRRAFEEGGYYVLGSDFDTPSEVRIVADAAPLGYLSIAAHGHADALSFTLSAGGEPLLIDPGTYAYHTQQRWRDYFRGTSAHNTVRIDGVDQSVSGGKFMWTFHATAKCERFDTQGAADLWQGSHAGYSRLSDPVKVTRELEYRRSERRLIVRDIIECRAEHVVEQFWHCAPGCHTRLVDGMLEVTGQGATIRLTLPRGYEAATVRGSQAPLLGWYSPRFDEKEPCDTLRVWGRVSGTTTIETIMDIGVADVRTIDTEHSGNQLLASL